jgi:hypothetical protein
MSVTAWVLWFSVQCLVLLGVLGIAMLGVTGRLTHHDRAGRSSGTARPHRHHLHLSFRHHAVH